MCPRVLGRITGCICECGPFCLDQPGRREKSCGAGCAGLEWGFSTASLVADNQLHSYLYTPPWQPIPSTRRTPQYLSICLIFVLHLQHADQELHLRRFMENSNQISNIFAVCLRLTAGGLVKNCSSCRCDRMRHYADNPEVSCQWWTRLTQAATFCLLNCCANTAGAKFPRREWRRWRL